MSNPGNGRIFFSLHTGARFKANLSRSPDLIALKYGLSRNLAFTADHSWHGARFEELFPDRPLSD